MKKEIILKKLLVLKDQLESNPWQYGWIIERIEEVDDLLNEQEEKPTEMTNNNQQKSQFWRNLDQDIQDHNSIVDDKTLIEQFVIECGKYGDTGQIPDEVIETYIRREKIKMEEIELDAKESAIIKQCAEKSTSEAHKKDIHRQQIIAAYEKGWEECNNLKYLPATYYETTYNTK